MRPESIDTARIAVVHEWISARAGSEQVFEAIAEAFPHADLYALSRDPAVPLETAGRKITTTFLDAPLLRDRRSLTLPVMPLAWRALGRHDYDIVISSHHAFAHANRLTATGLHLGYVYTPARYVWNPEIDSRGDASWMAPARAVLKQMDLAASRRVSSYAAISAAVRSRIAQHWGRDARVINPHVRVEYFQQDRPLRPQGNYVLGVGRWISYKRLDSVIRIADRAGLPVRIAGHGPEKHRLEAAAAAASVPVELIESPSDSELRRLYQHASCFVFPAVDDFGIVPVEALAAGTPVVALARGGTLDTVEHGRTGFLSVSGDEDELARLVLRTTELDRDECAHSAERFSRDRFQAEIVQWVLDELEVRTHQVYASVMS